MEDARTIVQCPRCSTRWRVATPSEGENPVFKCGRCHNTFRRVSDVPSATERRPATERPRPAPEVDNLEFAFRDRHDATPAGSGRESVAPPDGEAVSGASPAATDEPLTRGDAPVPAEGDQQGDEPDSAVDFEAPGGVPTRVLHVEDTMRASTPTQAFGPIRRVLLSFVAAHALLAVLIRANPDLGGLWLSRIPVLSAAFTAPAALVDAVELRNVEGRFARIRNARRVFVISGEAVNNSTGALEQIEIEGTLYGPGGALASMTVSTGNRTTLKLAELSESEIGLLQRFDPRITVAPGASAPFSLVFLDPPLSVREFSSRVSSARPTAPASAPPAEQTDRTHRASLG